MLQNNMKTAPYHTLFLMFLEEAKHTAGQMQLKYRIKPGSLRQWANRGKVRKRGRDESGRMLYDVADALALRDNGEEVA